MEATPSTGTRNPTDRRRLVGTQSNTAVSAVLIARRAFQIWESEGRPDSSIQCWTRAEAELRRAKD